MKVLVTGGCGFLGSHVCELFKEKGWGVIAYDNMSKYELMRTGYNVEAARDYNYNLLRERDMMVQKADVRDFDTLLKCTKGCDYIIHTAAQPAMTIALENPLFDFDNNALGTLNVLEVARQLGIPTAICSTIHMYGNGINEYLSEVPMVLKTLVEATTPNPGFDRFYRHPPAIGEDAPILTGSLTPLHASKRVGEIYAQVYVDSYDVRVAVFRLTGIYGPRQLGGEDHGWVANFAIRTILGLPIKVFGTDKQVRDILYVRDAALAFDAWTQEGCPSGIYNIGGGEPCITSIGQCLDILQKLIGERQTISLEPRRSGDLWYFCCNVDKAKAAFGWQPKVLPQEGIAKLVEWIQQERSLFQ